MTGERIPGARVEVIRRTFEAAKHPAGSEERTRLNLRAETSEYMPSHRYMLPGGKSFRTKREALAHVEAQQKLAEYKAREAAGRDAAIAAAGIEAGQVWRTDLDGLYCVVAVRDSWPWCKRARGYSPETRYGSSFQAHPAQFPRWERVTPAGA